MIADLPRPGWAFEYRRTFLGMADLGIICSKLRHGYVRELVGLLGLSERMVVQIEQPTLCRNLVVASKAFQVQQYVAPPAERLWRGMRARIPAARSGAPVERLYVSRRANPTRSLVEEEAIGAVFVSLGCRELFPAGVYVFEQIRLFAEARIIAGCSGSNLFNLAFAANVAAVLVMVSPLLVHYPEQMLVAHRSSVALEIIVGSVLEQDLAASPGNVHIPWHLDPAMVRALVVPWLQGLS